MSLLEDGLAVIQDSFLVYHMKTKLAQLQLVNIFGTKHGYLGLLDFLAATYQ